MHDELINAKEVADMLNCSTRQVWKLMASGRLPECLRLGRSAKWRLSDLQVFIRIGCNMAAFQSELARKA